MTVTYKQPFPGLDIQVPELHKVCYGESAKGFFMPNGKPLAMTYPKHDAMVLEWCEENCKSAWYRSPSYHNQCFIEFENDEDATLFALRWAS